MTPRATVWRRLQPALAAPCRRIILVPWLRHGGAERVALSALRAAEAQDGPGSALLVVTDSKVLDTASWLPAQTRLMVLEGAEGFLSLEDRVALVTALIQSVRPVAVLNVNSRVGWEMLLRHGRPLAQLTRLSAYVFCEDHDLWGRRVDYAYLHLRAALPHLVAVHSDHIAFLEGFGNDHSLPAREAAKLRPVPQPAPLNQPSPIAPHGREFRVLWAARVTAQKAPELVPAIAAAAPELCFDAHGAGTSAEIRAAFRHAPANFSHHGAFRDFAALGAQRHQVFLHTARWEGLPNVLLEAGAAGLPIVAALVGGVGELITEETGWPVTDHQNPAAFATALRAVAADPEEAARRAARLRQILTQRHSEAAHSAALSAAPGFLWDGPG
jgi:glycosyltransferase involved in cell wall biosynthesis